MTCSQNNKRSLLRCLSFQKHSRASGTKPDGGLMIWKLGQLKQREMRDCDLCCADLLTFCGIAMRNLFPTLDKQQTTVDNTNGNTQKI
ncbi:hypothetical protein CapIbe_012569 [Capra ibex]